MFKIMIFIGFLFTANAIAAVGKGHVSGKITNITSISSGLLVRINANEVPEHCTSGRVWMEIKQKKYSGDLINAYCLDIKARCDGLYFG